MVDQQDAPVNWFALAQKERLFEKKLVVRPRKDQSSHTRHDTSYLSQDGKVMHGKDGTEYRQIPTDKNYYISKDSVVKNLSGYSLRNTHVTSNNSKVKIQIDGQVVAVYRYKLLHLAWPELAPRYVGNSIFFEDEEFVVVEGFPDYIIGRQGTLIRLKNWSKNRLDKGRYHLSVDGKQLSRAVRRLVFENFGTVLE